MLFFLEKKTTNEYYICKYFKSNLYLFSYFPGQVSGVVLVPFSLHRWSSEPSLAHCSLARSPSLPPPLSSSATTTAATTAPNNNNNTPGGGSQASQPPGPPRSSHLGAAPAALAPGPLRRSGSMGRRPLLRHPNPHPPSSPSGTQTMNWSPRGDASAP